jgi:hypothetical protein
MTAFPSRIPPPANDVGQRQAGGGEEETFCGAIPSPPNCNDVLVPSYFCVAPPTATAVIGGCHRSLVIVPFLQTVAVIILVLLLLPKRTPIPDRDSHPRREAYDNGGWQHRRRDSHHVRCPLKVACVRTSVLSLIFPCRDCDDRPAPSSALQLSPPPWRIPIPTGGTPRSPRG